MSEFLISAAMIFSVVCFGGAGVLALAWAADKGQFRNFRRASESIFDADEPIGTPTDRIWTSNEGVRD
jgi:nitrogen fixation-related uncharacterized protein